jgi:hypothetical protein
VECPNDVPIHAMADHIRESREKVAFRKLARL